MDLTFQVPMQYCSLQHWTLLLYPVTSTTGYCFCFSSIPSFFLELFLHWPPVASLGTYQPGEFLIQHPIILPFHTVHGFLKARILKWFAILLSSGPHSVRPLHRLGWPHMAWLSFIELDNAVVHMIRWASFLWLWFQCVCPLMPFCNTYCLTWVSLTLDMGYLFTAAPAKCSRCSLPWTSRPSWPWTWSSSSRPSCTRAATAPWMWGCSSRQPPLTSNVG